MTEWHNRAMDMFFVGKQEMTAQHGSQKGQGHDLWNIIKIALVSVLLILRQVRKVIYSIMLHDWHLQEHQCTAAASLWQFAICKWWRSSLCQAPRQMVKCNTRQQNHQPGKPKWWRIFSECWHLSHLQCYWTRCHLGWDRSRTAGFDWEHKHSKDTQWRR